MVSSTSDGDKMDVEKKTEVDNNMEKDSKVNSTTSASSSSNISKGVASEKEKEKEKGEKKSSSVHEKDLKPTTSIINPDPSMIQPKDKIEFRMLYNDGSDFNCEHLVNLKAIFAKQLPKMPREYIVRLVFDRRHRSLALYKGGRVIGGICYRPYYAQRFAEIAFCAVSSTQQVKGYGTKLMQQLKEYVKREGILFFLTYADNYAIGYFQKQGFTKTHFIPKFLWNGFIKEYDGANLMSCYIHPTVNYLELDDMLNRQRYFIQQRILSNAKSLNVYPGLKAFRPPGQENKMDKDGKESKETIQPSGVDDNKKRARDNDDDDDADDNEATTKKKANTTSTATSSSTSSKGDKDENSSKYLQSVFEIPGVLEAGWTIAAITNQSDRENKLNREYGNQVGSTVDRSQLLTQRNAANSSIIDSLTEQQAFMFVNFGTERERERKNQLSNMISIVREIYNHDAAWPFQEPVDTEVVTDYLACVKDPIDLKTILDRLQDRQNVFYRSREMLKADLMRMCKNAKLYNKPNTEYYQTAVVLEDYIRNIFRRNESKKKNDYL